MECKEHDRMRLHYERAFWTATTGAADTAWVDAGTACGKSELSSNYIGMVERGLKEPGLATIVKLLNALNISADTLLCDLVPSASHVTDDEICKRLEGLTPIQKKRHSICWTPISAIFLISQTRNKITNFASASAEI